MGKSRQLDQEGFPGDRKKGWETKRSLREQLEGLPGATPIDDTKSKEDASAGTFLPKQPVVKRRVDGEVRKKDFWPISPHQTLAQQVQIEPLGIRSQNQSILGNPEDGQAASKYEKQEIFNDEFIQNLAKNLGIVISPQDVEKAQREVQSRLANKDGVVFDEKKTGPILPDLAQPNTLRRLVTLQEKDSNNKDISVVYTIRTVNENSGTALLETVHSDGSKKMTSIPLSDAVELVAKKDLEVEIKNLISPLRKRYTSLMERKKALAESVDTQPLSRNENTIDQALLSLESVATTEDAHRVAEGIERELSVYKEEIRKLERKPVSEPSPKAGAVLHPLTPEGYLKETSHIRPPTYQALPKVKSPTVGQTVTLQDANTHDIAKWKINSIDNGVATIENTEESVPSRKIGARTLKEVLRTNLYYKQAYLGSKDKSHQTPTIKKPEQDPQEEETQAPIAVKQPAAKSTQTSNPIERKIEPTFSQIRKGDPVELVNPKTNTYEEWEIVEVGGTSATAINLNNPRIKKSFPLAFLRKEILEKIEFDKQLEKQEFKNNKPVKTLLWLLNRLENQELPPLITASEPQDPRERERRIKATYRREYMNLYSGLSSWMNEWMTPAQNTGLSKLDRFRQANHRPGFTLSQEQIDLTTMEIELYVEMFRLMALGAQFSSDRMRGLEKNIVNSVRLLSGLPGTGHGVENAVVYFEDTELSHANRLLAEINEAERALGIHEGASDAEVGTELASSDVEQEPDQEELEANANDQEEYGSLGAQAAHAVLSKLAQSFKSPNWKHALIVGLMAAAGGAAWYELKKGKKVEGEPVAAVGQIDTKQQSIMQTVYQLQAPGYERFRDSFEQDIVTLNPEGIIKTYAPSCFEGVGNFSSGNTKMQLIGGIFCEPLLKDGSVYRELGTRERKELSALITVLDSVSVALRGEHAQGKTILERVDEVRNLVLQRTKVEA